MLCASFIDYRSVEDTESRIPISASASIRPAPSLIIDPLRILKVIGCPACTITVRAFIDYRSVEDTERVGIDVTVVGSIVPSLIIDPLRILKARIFAAGVRS